VGSRQVRRIDAFACDGVLETIEPLVSDANQLIPIGRHPGKGGDPWSMVTGKCQLKGARVSANTVSIRRPRASDLCSIGLAVKEKQIHRGQCGKRIRGGRAFLERGFRRREELRRASGVAVLVVNFLET